MQIPYEVTARRDTGLYNAKLGVWLFLASEVMLFGGLFSAYVFLRVGTQPGIDSPWPMGANVQNILPGFINTLVLIASSVFVVFAWVSLKERKYKTYQIWMTLVVLCAATFMVLKYFEYKEKLTAHHDIKLVNNSIIGGKILDGTDKIRFDAEKVTVDFNGGLPGFIGDIEGEANVEFKVTEGADEDDPTTVKLSAFRRWFDDQRREAMAELGEERKKRHHGDWDEAKDKPTVTKVTLEASFKLRASTQDLVGYDKEKLNFRDRTVIAGKLSVSKDKDKEVAGDAIQIEVHSVNLQMIPLPAQQTALLWKFLGEETKGQLFAQQEKKLKKVNEQMGEQLPLKVRQGPYINFLKVGHDDHGTEAKGKPTDPGNHGSEEPAAKGSDRHYPVVWIPRDQARFVTNHGPRAGTYYAIYFTMTGLHGLHVVGGALVLLFFLIFGKSLYQKNPEHLANRVEVGGLFWHFVDLVWIFLFPIMYLM